MRLGFSAIQGVDGASGDLALPVPPALAHGNIGPCHTEALVGGDVPASLVEIHMSRGIFEAYMGIVRCGFGLAVKERGREGWVGDTV